MSVNIFAVVPSLRLQSLDDVQQRLDLPQESANLDTHVSGHERALQLGRAIRDRMSAFDERLARVDDIERGTPLERAIKTLGHASSLQEALAAPEQQLLRQMTERHLPAEGRGALQVIGEAEALLDAGDTQALPAMTSRLEQAIAQLGEASRSAHRSLLQAEAEVLTDKATASLEQLGYDVRLGSHRDGTLVRGVKDDLSIVAQVDEEGALHLDAAGFEGTACQDEMDRLCAELERRGVTVAVQESTFHGKPQGSALTHKAEEVLPKEHVNPLQEERRRDRRTERQRERLLRREQRRLRRR